MKALEKLREVHEAATGGEWETDGAGEFSSGSWGDALVFNKYGGLVADTASLQDAPPDDLSMADARAIATYHNTFGALLDFAEAVYMAADNSPTMCAGPAVNPAFQRLRAALEDANAE